MTAEIAILNRRAIALSADSAVTISETGKIYNSADKIFELSTTDPIGLMVYNTLDYMGIPLDVVIKAFRESPRCVSFRTVFDAASAFFDFVRNDFQISKDAEHFYIENILFDHARSLYVKVRNKAAEGLATRMSDPRQSVSINFEEIFNLIIDDEIRKWRSYAINDCMYDVDLKQLSSSFSHTIDSLLSQVSPLIASAGKISKEKFVEYCCLAIQRNIFSSNHTGLVFAGYSYDQLFPSLVSYCFDGMILSRLKLQERDNVTIDSYHSPAKIIPFAQREMADRFLFGIEAGHERAILTNLRHSMHRLAAGAAPLMKGMQRKRREMLERYMEDAGAAAIDGLRQRTIHQLKNASESESLDAVSVMTKPDLANFAEALVNITSVKRRASLETETVGGPIDVAVISRDDGFIWVKRKHYFERDLNPRFFHRKYSNIGTPSAEEGT
jgi:hypothetical protein